MKKSDLIKEVENLRHQILQLQQWSFEKDNLIQKNSLLASIVESSQDAIVGLTVNATIVSWNKAAAKMFGHNFEETFGHHASMLAPPERHQEFMNMREKVLLGQHIPYFQTTRLRKNGATFPIISSLSPIFNGKREIVGMSEIMHDITVRKDMEAALLRNEAKYRSIFENAVEGIFQTTEQGQHLRVNPAYVRMFGYSSEEELKAEISDVGRQMYANPDDRARFLKLMEQNGEVRNFEVEAIRKDGASMWLSVNARAVKDMGSDTVFYEGMVEDRTKRKHAEQIILEREEKYRQLFELESDAIFLIDSETGRILEANKSASSLYGFSKEEFLQKTNADLSAEPARTNEAIRKELRVVPLRYHRKKDGTVFPVEITATHMTWDGRKSHLAAIRDISDRQKIEEALLKREEDYRNIYDNAMVGIFQSLPEGKYFRVNSALARIHGFNSPDEMISTVTNIGEHLYVDREDRKRYMKLLDKTSKITNFEAQLFRKDRSKVWISMNVQVIRGKDGAVAYYEGIVEDITERKKAEEDLKASAEKLRKNLAGTIEVISMMLQTRDPYTGEHQKRVSSLARAIAQEMKLPGDTIDSIRIAGSIHDIGKMSVPAEILAKPTRLSDVEMDLLKVHPQTGYDILKVVELPPPIAEIVLQHHERVDGSGYPQGLKEGEAILEAQILAVADVVEAMSSHRPYRPALGIDAALREIEGGKGTLYHPEVVDACLRLFRGKTFSFG